MNERIIISLTSYPLRIASVDKVIVSLMNQSIQGNKILLWLSELEFPRREGDLPQELLSLIGVNNFEIRWVKENLKSHKKYFYVLKEYADSIVITVDDDVCYGKNMIKELVESHQKHPRSISARKARIMLKNKESLEKYQKWYRNIQEYIDQERQDICAIGAGGVLYPPGCSSERWFDRENLTLMAPKQDDLWLKFNELIDCKTVVYTGNENEDIIIEGTQESALCKSNLYGNENDVCISKLSRILRCEYNDIWQCCIGSFMCELSFWRKKGEVYVNKISNMLDEYSTYKAYICGAGKYAKIVFTLFNYYNLDKKIDAFLVTKKQDKEEMLGKPIQVISTLKRDEKLIVLCGVGEKNQREIKHVLEAYRSCVWVDTDIMKIKIILSHLGVITCS